MRCDRAQGRPASVAFHERRRRRGGHGPLARPRELSAMTAPWTRLAGAGLGCSLVFATVGACAGSTTPTAASLPGTQSWSAVGDTTKGHSAPSAPPSSYVDASSIPPTPPVPSDELRRCLERRRAPATPPPSLLALCSNEVDQAAAFVEGLTETGIATPDQARCLHDSIMALDAADVAALLEAVNESTPAAKGSAVVDRLFTACHVDPG